MRYRELTEIDLAHGFNDDEEWDKTAPMSFDSRQHSFDLGDDEGDYALIGKIDDLEVVEVLDDNDEYTRNTTVVVFNKGERVAYMQAAYSGLIDDAMQIKGVRVDPRYRGRNIALRLYELIIKQGLCSAIIADDVQTPEGKALWSKMLASKRFRIAVIDQQNDRTIPIKTEKMLAQVYDYSKYDREHMYLVAS